MEDVFEFYNLYKDLKFITVFPATSNVLAPGAVIIFKDRRNLFGCSIL